MTAREAYFYGFCKTAADAGFDPGVLAKIASMEKSARGLPMSDLINMLQNGLKGGKKVTDVARSVRPGKIKQLVNNVTNPAFRYQRFGINSPEELNSLIHYIEPLYPRMGVSRAVAATTPATAAAAGAATRKGKGLFSLKKAPAPAAAAPAAATPPSAAAASGAGGGIPVSKVKNLRLRGVTMPRNGRPASAPVPSSSPAAAPTPSPAAPTPPTPSPTPPPTPPPTPNGPAPIDLTGAAGAEGAAANAGAAGTASGGPAADLGNAAATANNAAANAAASRTTGSWAGDAIGRYFSRLFGSPAIRAEPMKKIQELNGEVATLTQAYHAAKKMENADPATLQALAQSIMDKKTQIESLYKPIADESRKVFRTRLLTGAAGIGGLGIALNNSGRRRSWY